MACSTPPPGPAGDGGPFTVSSEPPEYDEDTDDVDETGPYDTAISPEGTTSEATGWIHADAGPWSTCGVRAAGEIECWGALASSPYQVPAGQYLQVSVGNLHACAITTSPRTLVCWGNDDFGQASPPLETGWVEVTAGGNHTCARREVGTVECWGDNNQGQHGLPELTYDQIAAGYEHTCGIDSLSGVVFCAGSDGFGESSVPFTFGAYNTSVAAGRYVTCAITSNDYGSVCAGDAEDLQISDQYHDNTDIAVGDFNARQKPANAALQNRPAW